MEGPEGGGPLTIRKNKAANFFFAFLFVFKTSELSLFTLINLF